MKVGRGLGRPVEQAAEALEADAVGAHPGGHGRLNGQVVGPADDLGDVLGPALEGFRGDAPAGQLLPQAEQVPLAHGLVVGQERNARDARHALDLDARAAADADVDVLAGGPDAGPHPPGAADDAAEDLGHFGHLLGGAHVGSRDRLDERHAQPVGEIGPAVADIADFAAGIFLQAELDDLDLAVL